MPKKRRTHSRRASFTVSASRAPSTRESPARQTSSRLHAEKCGTVLGLENHWGFVMPPEWLLRMLQDIPSPRFKATLNTGIFLEEPYDKMAAVEPQVALVQAKTYYSGGRWYALDPDCARLAAVRRQAGRQGHVSLAFEGNEEVVSGVSKSLARLRQHF